MPGKKHMNQDRRPVDGQDTLQTMQDKKSGIYQDRTDGKLPQSRVAQHYQDMDAKMEQATVKDMKNQLKAAANFVGSGGPLKDMASSAEAAYNAYVKPTVDKAIKAKETTFGKDFFKDNIVEPIKSDAKAVYKKITG